MLSHVKLLTSCEVAAAIMYQICQFLKKMFIVNFWDAVQKVEESRGKTMVIQIYKFYVKSKYLRFQLLFFFN